MPLLRWSLPLFAVLAVSVLAVPSQGAPAAPEIGVLIERISRALGGPEGGRGVLDGKAELEFAFRRTVRDAITTKEVTADHRYVVERAGRRLDIRMVDGEGTDSAVVVHGEEAWVVAGGKKHDADPALVLARLEEFSPGRIFSVPLALATEGRQILGDAELAVVGRIDDAGKSRFILVGQDEEGVETARLEVDARTYRPVEVAFRSPSGEVVYRYADYREVEPGLVVPFEREFLRNGNRVSRTVVSRLGFRVPADPVRFDADALRLSPLGLKVKAR